MSSVRRQVKISCTDCAVILKEKAPLLSEERGLYLYLARSKKTDSPCNSVFRLSYIIPPVGIPPPGGIPPIPIAGSSLGISATMASVVMSRPETLAAF